MEGGSVVGLGDGFGSDVESVTLWKGDKDLPSNLTMITGDVSKINGTVEGTPPDSHINGSDPFCLPVPSDWSICSGKWPKSFTLPNFFFSSFFQPHVCGGGGGCPTGVGVAREGRVSLWHRVVPLPPAGPQVPFTHRTPAPALSQLLPDAAGQLLGISGKWACPCGVSSPP